MHSETDIDTLTRNAGSDGRTDPPAAAPARHTSDSAPDGPLQGGRLTGGGTSALTVPDASPTEAALAMKNRKIGEILCDDGVLSEEQVRSILERQQFSGGKLFGEIAIAMGLATREQVIGALSQQFGFSYSRTTSDAPAHKELVMANAPFADEVECFRNLRTDLSMSVLSPAQLERPALAFVSANIGDGKTFVLSNVAVAFSQARMRTLVIDADLRSPRLHEVFDVDNRIGLSNVLSGRCEAQVIQPVSYLPNLYMLPAGTLAPNPTELIHQPAFDLLLRELLTRFEVVLVDTPAAEHGTDAAVVAARCGAALVIARKGSTKASALQQLMNRLRKSKTTLAGVMMNTV